MRNLLKVLAVVFLCLGLVGSISPARSEMISFQEGVSPSTGYVVGDTYVRGNTALVNNNYGAATLLWVGNDASSKVNGLLEFDLSEIVTQAGGQDVIIDGVQLVLNASDFLGGTTIDVDVHRYGYDFAEAASTWNDPDGDGSSSTGDTTAGGTFGVFLTSKIVNATGDVTFADTAAFRTAVSGALGETDNTLRLILRDINTSHTGSGWSIARFCSSEYGTSASRPELIVNFTAVPEPSSLALLCCGGLAMICMARRRMKRGKP